MCIHIKYSTPEFRQEYDIDELTNCDGYVYCEIRKEVYGLKEAECVTIQNLVKISECPQRLSVVRESILDYL